MGYTINMYDNYRHEPEPEIKFPLKKYDVTFEGLVVKNTFEIKTVTCTCGKCGASLTGQIVVEDYGKGNFNPASPYYGGMDRSMTTHHTQTNDGGGGDGEHNLFFITGEIDGFAFVSGQGCGIIKPRNTSR